MIVIKLLRLGTSQKRYKIVKCSTSVRPLINNLTNSAYILHISPTATSNELSSEIQPLRSEYSEVLSETGPPKPQNNIEFYTDLKSLIIANKFQKFKTHALFRIVWSE